MSEYNVFDDRSLDFVLCLGFSIVEFEENVRNFCFLLGGILCEILFFGNLFLLYI